MSRLFRHREERKSLWQRIKELAFTDVSAIVKGIDPDSLERLEELLLGADFGVAATLKLVDRVEDLTRRGKIQTEDQLLDAVEDEITTILESGDAETSLHFADSGPTVFLIVGVNGVGKTTSIGKLAHRLQRSGRRTLLAAGDTFRAGAIEQLQIWAERTGSEFVGASQGADPAAVAFDAIEAADARNVDTVIVDTAGRLHTQGDLMAELEKVERVIKRKLPGAPHETLLVLDATTGQNALSQARTFGKTLDLSGLILSKLDSTAKGGIVVALKEEFDLPVKLIGTGEGIDDMQEFEPRTFAREVLTE